MLLGRSHIWVTKDWTAAQKMSSRTAKTVDDELQAASAESEVRNLDVFNTEMQTSATEDSCPQHIHEERR